MAISPNEARVVSLVPTCLRDYYASFFEFLALGPDQYWICHACSRGEEIILNRGPEFRCRQCGHDPKAEKVKKLIWASARSGYHESNLWC